MSSDPHRIDPALFLHQAALRDLALLDSRRAKVERWLSDPAVAASVGKVMTHALHEAIETAFRARAAEPMFRTWAETWNPRQVSFSLVNLAENVLARSSAATRAAMSTMDVVDALTFVLDADGFFGTGFRLGSDGVLYFPAASTWLEGEDQEGPPEDDPSPANPDAVDLDVDSPPVSP